MFTNLANYLLGTQQPQPAEQQVAEDCSMESERLKAMEADDDWILVDNNMDGDGQRIDAFEESIFETLPPFDLALSTVPYCLPDPSPSFMDFYTISRTSSYTSLPCRTLEESWFLTPPPCFTSECPVSMETSPLENLLIEHPSMSVYQHHSPSSHPVRSPRGRSDSTGGSSNGSTTSEGEATAATTPPRRRSGPSTAHQHDKQCIQMRSAQKVRVHRANQVLKRNTLDRNNKAREMNSTKNKRQRRADRQQQRSGANNDRKSCKSNGKCC